MRPRLGMLLFLALMVSVGLWAQNDPLIGTWKMNVAKSKYSPGPAPKSGTTKISAVPGGIRLVTNGVNADGKATVGQYTAKFDGKDYPIKSTVAGKPNPNAADAESVKKIDDHTYEVTAKRKGEVLNVTRWVISADGKTRTNTVTGKNAEGQTVDNTIVFEKQ
jgi:hypothetical protein